jgi:hypothetical protein
VNLRSSICAGIKLDGCLAAPATHTAVCVPRPDFCRVGAPLVLRQLLTWFVGYEQSDGDTQASLQHAACRRRLHVHRCLPAHRCRPSHSCWHAHSCCPSVTCPCSCTRCGGGGCGLGCSASLAIASHSSTTSSSGEWGGTAWRSTKQQPQRWMAAAGGDSNSVCAAGRVACLQQSQQGQ